MSTQILTVDGMTCGGCANGVKKALGALTGVSNVDVTLETRLVTIEHDDRVSIAQLCDTIENAGFDVVG